MTDHLGWYPPGQICYPPELPAYYKNVHDLKPIVGVPSDDEVIGIHVVIYAASRISSVPGMHDPYLFMKLSDHLFSIQLARYRSTYSFITFPSDATYTPPVLPAHVSVDLETVSGTPSDKEMIKVQDAVRAYQRFSGVPSMFDQHVNMELSQHLFNIQMARYMRLAGETQPELESQETAKPENSVQQPTNMVEGVALSTNHAGICGDSVGVQQASPSALDTNVCELMERSNQLAERFNVLLERSNELAEQYSQPRNNLNPLMELFKQALGEFTQITERTHQPMQQTDLQAARLNDLFHRFNEMANQFNQPTHHANQFAERAHQLMERSNQLDELLCQPIRQFAERSNQLFEQSAEHSSQLNQAMKRSNELAERLNQILADFHPIKRSNEISERANQLAEQLGQSSKRSNQLAEQANMHTERLGDVMKNINKVLVGVQHAVVRCHKGSTMSTLDCLVNEQGDTTS
ncbi:unnamed protein product [Rhizoctonia solani]|uniref:Laminin domain protein n=1 Tax=Rhizoctonia solani TaxID=456999 RepID=A0A8H3GVY5_9AGAM|nr:unnamed protein product [Rhizoctonia solani]